MPERVGGFDLVQHLTFRISGSSPSYITNEPVLNGNMESGCVGGTKRKVLKRKFLTRKVQNLKLGLRVALTARRMGKAFRS